MVAPRHRSRSKKRVHKRVPGGATKLRFEARKPKVAKCGSCGRALRGIPRLGNAAAKNTPKSKKTVARAYGGSLCPACLRAKLKSQIRGQ
ncbi:50S ribosomal protein L34e [Candidatus Woesearchaeota archaeon]|nr:50S ribosomal protein L34e [Candidatus Woesearchaeota archaeon]